MAETITLFDHQSAAYQQAFQTFLSHTDQKTKAREWLEQLAQQLPRKEVFIDAGAGNGSATAWLAGEFRRAIAIEPSPYLCEELRRRCPAVEVQTATIREAQPAALGDLVLCSHVLYHIEPAEWLDHLEKLTSWLAPQGTLVVALANPEADTMRMLAHFSGRRFDLAGLAERFQASAGNGYAAAMATVPAQIMTADLDTAYRIAEFILSNLPLTEIPSRTAVETYVREYFSATDGGFRFSCDQDFLTIL